MMTVHKRSTKLSLFSAKGRFSHLGNGIVAGDEEVGGLAGHEPEGSPAPLTVVHLLVSVLNLRHRQI